MSIFTLLFLLTIFAPFISFTFSFLHSSKIIPKILMILGFFSLVNLFVQEQNSEVFHFYFVDFVSNRELMLLALCSYLATTIWILYTFNHQRSRNIYLLLGSNLALIFSANLWTLLTFWVIHLAPMFFDTNTMKRFNGWRKIGIFGFYQLIGLVSLIICLNLLNPFMTDFHLSSLRHIEDSNIPKIAIFFVMLTIFIRNGVFPFHSWVRGIAQDATPPLFFTFLAFQTGNLLFYKVAMPLINHEAKGFFPYISVITLFSGIYWALVAIGEKNLRLAMAGVFSAQLSIISTGFELDNILGVQGGFIKWYALLIAFTVLGLLIYLMERRADIDDITNPQALMLVAPRMAMFFFLIGFSMIGMPFTLGFIGEDILVHNVIEHYPWLGLALTFTTSLNGFVLYRIYSFIFGGRHLVHKQFKDIELVPSLGFIIMMLIILVIGFYPNIIFH